MNFKIVAVALLGMVFTIRPDAANAQCGSAPVTVQVVTTGTHTSTCAQDPLTGRWNLTVTINGPVTNNSTVTIRGANTLQLGRVTVQNNSAIDCRVNILGSGFDQRIGGVGYIDKGTSGPNRVLLLQLNTVGDVGYDRPASAAIRMDMIGNLSVGGSILGDLVSEGTTRSMAEVYIQGDLRGGISLGPASSLDSLWVGGSIGQADEPPVALSISGNILSLTAGAVHADITTLANGAEGTVHRFETTAGPFRGFLRAHRVGPLATGPGPARFQVAGDLDAGMAITRDIRAPFFVGGNFKAARTVNGSDVPNEITATRGLFDDPAADPTASMHIVGNFEGQMTLGTPLSSGLGSINRNLIVGGDFSGALTTTADAAASMLVTGSVPGDIFIDGQLRSGCQFSCGAPLTGALTLGGALAGTINLPAAGLKGQITINARNAGGAWMGAVMVGGINPFNTIPHYDVPAELLGGGAIGVVPFSVNLGDCTPPHTTSQPQAFAPQEAFDNPANRPVSLRAYGPMAPSPGFALAQSVAIEQQTSGGGWVNRAAYFTVTFDPPGENGRVLTLSGSGSGRPPAGVYRIRPLGLVCANVSGSPAVSFPQPYIFRIEPDCDGNGHGDAAEIASAPGLDADGNGVLDACEDPVPGCPCDFNASGGVTVQDVFDFLGAYFNVSPMADFNMSGTITIQDIFDFLNCYFSRPAGC